MHFKINKNCFVSESSIHCWYYDLATKLFRDINRSKVYWKIKPGIWLLKRQQQLTRSAR